MGGWSAFAGDSSKISAFEPQEHQIRMRSEERDYAIFFSIQVYKPYLTRTITTNCYCHSERTNMQMAGLRLWGYDILWHETSNTLWNHSPVDSKEI